MNIKKNYNYIQSQEVENQICNMYYKKSQLFLHECMHKGANLLPDLIRILLTFFKENVAVVADIKKVFHQIGLHPDDRDVTRFLWTKNPSKPLDLFVYNRHI